MAEVDVKSTTGPHNTHTVPSPTSPKKRSFEEIENPEAKPEVGPHMPPAPVLLASSSLGEEAQTPAASQAVSSTAFVENTISATTVPNTDMPPPPPPTLLSPPNLATASVHTPASAPPAAPVAPNKKVKLTPAEKEAKEKQRAEEKIRKEEEKRIKEEEKKKRDEEREQKRKLKEQEKEAKEEERKKKEEEKSKKERSQMRLNAFFGKPPSTTIQSRTDNTADSTGKPEELNATPENESSEKQQLSDYQHEFPSFFVQSHVKVGPPHRFERDSGGLNHARENIDKTLGVGSGSVPSQSFNPAETFRIMPYKRRQGRAIGPTVKEVLVSMQDPSLNQIDLTGDRGTLKPTSRLDDALRKIPMKMLKFGQDVRPPYQGTFSKRLPERTAVKLCRNPFARAVDSFNYDYDSEAEWEEPEEGENLSSEGEEDGTEDGEDDMDDFLDDADDEIKRKTIVGDLEPVCSGIRWDDGKCADPATSCFKMEVISETLTFPIDPFSDTYWKPVAPPQPSNNSPFKVPNHPNDSRNHSTTLKQPQQFPQPNPPLSKSSAAAAGVGPNGNPNTAKGQIPRVLLPAEHLTEFKDLVSGSDLTKAGLVEVLKKRFPKVSKDAIKETLTAVAVRRGLKEVDKRWVLT